MKNLSNFGLAGLLALTPAAALAQAGPAPAAGKVAVLVVVPTPPGLARQRIEAGMQATVPQYQKLPGLIRKYFTIGSDGFGGMYLFESRAAADAWFNAAWHARVTATYGRDGQVTYFDVPIAIEGPAR